MRYGQTFVPRVLVTAALFCLPVAEGGWTPVRSASAGDDAVAPVAEEALEDEDVAAAPVDAERLERTEQEMEADEAPKAEAVQWVQIGAQPGVQQFMPLLKQALTVEIHYLRKICNPSPVEVAAIRKASEARLPEIAKELNGGRNAGFRGDGKSTRQKVIDVMQSAADKTLPAEQARRYRNELKARQEARREGAAEMMTVHVDRRLAFSNEQYDRVPEVLLKNWKLRWSRNLQAFMYDDYCPLPDVAALNGVLTDRQKEMWKSHGRDSRIGFGWQSDVGLGQLGGGAELQELDDYSGVEEQ